MDEYDGRQFVGIDLHRQRSVIVRQSESGEQLSAVRIVNDPVAVNWSSSRLAPTPRWCWKRRTAGTGRSTCCRPAERGCIWRSVGSQRVPLAAREKRCSRRRRSGRSAADGPTTGGVDRPTPDPRIAGVGALSRQAGRDPIRTEGPDPRSKTHEAHCIPNNLSPTMCACTSTPTHLSRSWRCSSTRSVALSSVIKSTSMCFLRGLEMFEERVISCHYELVRRTTSAA